MWFVTGAQLELTAPERLKSPRARGADQRGGAPDSRRAETVPRLRVAVKRQSFRLAIPTAITSDYEMLFDTPGLSIASSSVLGGGPSASGSKKRKTSDDPNSKSSIKESAEVNLDKLMKRMKSMDNTTTDSTKQAASPKPKPAKQPKQQQQQQQQPQSASKPKAQPKQQPHQDGKPARWEPAKKDKRASAQAKKDKKAQREDPSSFVTSANMIPTDRSAAWTVRDDSATLDAPATPSAPPRRFTAPTLDDVEAGASTSAPKAPQTSLQTALRAKLAGGKFRMLNETLYTTTGAEAWETMKDEGAFDDYHAGFRGQAAHWPVQPINLITTSLLETLEPRSLVADFGCGDAQLARSLAEDEAKEIRCLSFDLVSKDSWVVEAECSSVPLPGGRGGEIVDAVVCCLSLMGTDWINCVREARRILRTGGALKIAEVTSRFTDVDKFVALIEAVGFSLDSKDTSNTHFMMFDFVKTAAQSAGEGNPRVRADQAKKAEGVLKPCIYKKR